MSREDETLRTATIVLRYRPVIEGRPDIAPETAAALWRDALDRQAGELAETNGCEAEIAFGDEAPPCPQCGGPARPAYLLAGLWRWRCEACGGIVFRGRAGALPEPRLGMAGWGVPDPAGGDYLSDGWETPEAALAAAEALPRDPVDGAPVTAAELAEMLVQALDSGEAPGADFYARTRLLCGLVLEGERR